MLPLEEAFELLEKHCAVQKKEICVAVEEAYGCIVACDIYAGIFVPEFSRAAMDGYAVNARDISDTKEDRPISLKVIGEVLAGEYCEYKLSFGEAVRIMTGAMMPQGADCVVKQEDTDYGIEEVKIYKSAVSGENYCNIGEDIKKGDLVVEKFTKLNSVHIGILSSIGIDTIKILAPMKVAILVSGSELIESKEALVAGKIYNSIGSVIKVKLREMKFEVTNYILCPDEKNAMKEIIEQFITEADVLITTGGVSVGKKDLLPELLAQLGEMTLFHRVKIKPGTPVMAVLYKGKMILSLSGNPFAALVTFEVFFSKIAAIFMQNKSFLPRKEKAVYQGSTLKANQQRRYVRALIAEGKVVAAKVHASSVLSNMAELNCYIIQPEETMIENGDLVEVSYIQIR